MTHPETTKPLSAYLQAGEIEIRTGPFGTQLKASEYVDEGTPVINVRNIGLGSLRPEKVEYLPEKVATRLHQHWLRAGDIVFGRKGAVERHLLVKENQAGWIQGSDCIRVRIISGSLNPRFLSYCLLLEEHQSWIQSQASHGATMATLNQGIIERIRIPERTTSEQQRIVAILSAYDDLFEVNQRRIAILENMARRLFDEWFVRFRYPGHEAAPLVETELGMVPEGWQIETARQALTYTGGGTPSKAEPSYWHDGDIQWFTPTDLTKSGETFQRRSSLMITKEGLAKSSARLFPAFSIMMTSRATLGVFAINTEPATTNQGFITFIPSSRTPVYFLFHMLKREFPRMEAVASGATFKEITKGALGELLFPFPPEHLAYRFEQLVTPMMEQIAIISRQNDSLRAARDLLLPKLISGEIDVSVAEEAFAEAAE